MTGGYSGRRFWFAANAGGHVRPHGRRSSFCGFGAWAGPNHCFQVTAAPVESGVAGGSCGAAAPEACPLAG